MKTRFYPWFYPALLAHTGCMKYARALVLLFAMAAYLLSLMWILELGWWAVTDEPCGPLTKMPWKGIWRELAA